MAMPRGVTVGIGFRFMFMVFMMLQVVFVVLPKYSFVAATAPI
jgi:hypothetical protein